MLSVVITATLSWYISACFPQTLPLHEVPLVLIAIVSVGIYPIYGKPSHSQTDLDIFRRERGDEIELKVLAITLTLNGKDFASNF